MCRGDRLIADFVAGTDARPSLPAVLGEHLTTTADGLWVVWAYKLARQKEGDLFVPLTGGPGYPADARARCRFGGVVAAHDSPDPGCTCGFHAISSRRLPFPVGPRSLELTVALSGRVLAFDWAGGGVLWRAERQTVVRAERPARHDRDVISLPIRRPDDPDGRLAVVPAPAPHGSGPVRLSLPVSPPVLPMCHDDAGWCLGAGTAERSPAALVLV